jgi:hypothetical protein
MKKLFVYLIVMLISGCAINTNPVVRKDLPGWWGWSGSDDICNEIVAKYSFSEDGMRVLVHTPNGASFGEGAPQKDLAYVIESEISHVLRIKGVGEERRTDNGKLVVWDLVMKDSDTFCWHRTDWKATNCTKDFVRCDK